MGRFFVFFTVAFLKIIYLAASLDRRLIFPDFLVSTIFSLGMQSVSNTLGYMEFLQRKYSFFYLRKFYWPMHVFPINHIVRRSIGKALHFSKITSCMTTKHYYLQCPSLCYAPYFFLFALLFLFLNSRASLLMDVVILVKIRVGKIFIGRMYSLGSKGIRPCTVQIMIHKLPLLQIIIYG